MISAQLGVQLACKAMRLTPPKVSPTQHALSDQEWDEKLESGPRSRPIPIIKAGIMEMGREMTSPAHLFVPFLLFGPATTFQKWDSSPRNLESGPIKMRGFEKGRNCRNEPR